MNTIRFSVFLLLALVLPGLAAADSPGRIRIVLVGDSTVTDHDGWGLGFRQFIDETRAEVINTAQNGRSSMSFIKEGRWEKALALKGDYYLIQFGHNDEPGKPGRSTTLDEYRGYMNRYVDEARAIGAKPVLVTCLVRRQFDPADPHKINSSLVGHVAIMKALLQDLRLRERRDVLKDILEHSLPTTLQDVVIVFVTVTGMKKGRLVQETYANKVYGQTLNGVERSAIRVLARHNVFRGCAIVQPPVC